MKIIKKNQIIIYTLALMLVTAGYLNFVNNPNNTKETAVTISEGAYQNESLEDTSNKNEDNLVENAEGKLIDNNKDLSIEHNINNNQEKETEQNTYNNQENNKIADIGDATLVSSNDVVNSSSVNNGMVNSTNATNSVNTGENVTVNSNDIVEDYFAKTKLEREKMYSQMFESYEKILNNTNSSDEQKQTVTEEIKNINKTRNSIMICENLIKTKGFDNSVVFVNGDSVSVIIGAEKLETDELAQIQNIISRELNADIENIHISIK